MRKKVCFTSGDGCIGAAVTVDFGNGRVIREYIPPVFTSFLMDEIFELCEKSGYKFELLQNNDDKGLDLYMTWE